MHALREDDPKSIGKYTLEARLGAGGMGVVFLAKDGEEKVALKVVRNSFLDDTSLKSRFVREIQTLQKINSPRAGRILDYGVESDFAWHAVEFIDGPTLKEHVDANGPLDEQLWEQLAQQLHEALNDVHKSGVIHRDIKPANLILGRAGMKLIDFGIAQADDATSLTTTGLVAGSPAWLSPEQLDGMDVTSASDLFSAGSVLYYAATGDNPWSRSDTTSVSAVVTRILTATPDLSRLTSTQQAVIGPLLHPKPSMRKWPDSSATSIWRVAESSSGPASPAQPVVKTDEASVAIRAPQASRLKNLVIVSALAVAVIAFTFSFLFPAVSDVSGDTVEEAPQATEVARSSPPVPFVRLLEATVEGIEPGERIIGDLVARPQHDQILMFDFAVDGSTPSSLYILDSTSLSPLASLGAGANPVVSPDGRLISTTFTASMLGEGESSQDASCVLIELDSADVQYVFPNVSRYSCFATFSPDSERYYFVDRLNNGSVDQGDADDYTSKPIRVQNLETGEEEESLDVGLNCIDLLAHNSLLFVSSRQERATVAVVDVEAQAVIASIDTGGPGDYQSSARDFLMSPDGKTLFFRIDRGFENSEVWVVDINEFDVKATFELHGSQQVTNHAISPDGRFLAVGNRSEVNEVIIIDIETEEIVQRSEVGTVQSVMFSPDGRLYVAGESTIVGYEYSDLYEAR